MRPNGDNCMRVLSIITALAAAAFLAAAAVAVKANDKFIRIEIPLTKAKG